MVRFFAALILVFSSIALQPAHAQQVQINVNEAIGSCSETEMIGTWKLIHAYQEPEGETQQAFDGGYIDYLIISEGLGLKFFTTQDDFTSEKQIEVRLIEIEEIGPFIPHRFRLGKNDVMQMTREGKPVQYFRCNMIKLDMNEKMKAGDMILNSSTDVEELVRVFRKL